MRHVLMVALTALILSSGAMADLRVIDSVDVIRLVDGQEIRGTVVASGMRAVIVLVEGRERIVRRSDVAEIVRGEALPTIRSYLVANVDGLALVVAEGQRDDALSEEAMRDRVTEAASQPAVVPTAPRQPDVIPPDTVRELMKDPRVGNLVRQFGGEEQALQLLRQHRNHPMVRNFLDEFQRTGKIPPGLEGFINN